MIVTTVAGRVGKDAEMRTAGQSEVCSFPVAGDVGYGERKQTIWFDCSLFGQRGAKLRPYLTKGTPVTVFGEMTTREHNGKTYHNLKVLEIALQGQGRQEPASDDMNEDPPF